MKSYLIRRICKKLEQETNGRHHFRYFPDKNLVLDTEFGYYTNSWSFIINNLEYVI